MLIRYKLSIAFGTISVLACGAGAIAMLINSRVRADVDQIVHDSVNKPKAADGMSASLMNIGLHWQELLAAQSDSKTAEGMRGQNAARALAQDVEDVELYLADCYHVSKRGGQLALAEGQAEEIKAAQDEEALLDEIRDKFVEMKVLLERQVAAANTGPQPSGAALRPAWKLQHEELTTLVKSYHTAVENQLNGEVQEVGRSLNNASRIMLWSTLTIFVAAGLLAWFVTRTFTRPLNLLAMAAQRIGEGQLNTAVALDSKDEFGLLGQTVNRMAADLQASMDYADGILRSMISSLIVVGTDGTIKSVNGSTLELLGYVEAELLGQSLERVLQTPGRSLLSILEAAAQRGLIDVEFIYQTKLGRAIPVSFSASALRGAAGATTGLVCVAQDITERKRAAEAIQQSQKRLRDLIDGLGPSIFVGLLTPQGILIEINQSPLTAAGLKPEDVLGKPFDETPWWSDSPETQRQLREAIARAAGGEASRYDVRTQGAGNQVIDIDFSLQPLRDETGEVVFLIPSASVITERKLSEAALEKTHKQLVEASHRAGMAEVATSVLHNVGNVLNSVNVASSCVANSLRKSKAQDLSKVVALLREHEKELGDFFTNDPRGRQVPAYLALLAGHLAGEQAEALKELAHLQKNIEHIKDIVTVQQGLAKASGVTEAVNVTELVEDALRMNASGLARHDIQVIKEFKDTPLVTVEKHKVLQILVNLVCNAKHACETLELHERKVTIHTTNGDNRVRIAVCDNGVGIPRENLDRIFSHGFTTKKDGHGFGLHSAALAAKKMGGSLTVHSDGPGRGATFILELPSQPEAPAA